MRNKALLVVVAIAVLVGIATYLNSKTNPAQESGTPSSDEVSKLATPPAPAPVSDTNTGTQTVTEVLKSNPTPDLNVDESGLSKATAIFQTTKGTFKFKFYTKDAPNTVNRMVELILKGFYNGLTFHRVEPGFVIQGGDPLGNGTGGSGVSLKAEFNKRRHVEGTVAMARASDPDSADSQFYVCLGLLPQLDEKYTVFGQVTEGMDVVRKIQVGDKMTNVVVQ